MKERFQCTVAVHLLLIKDKKLLLLRRYNTGFCDGMFSVPAGHIDGSEDIIEAMLREIKEEITIEIDKKDLEFIQVMHRRKPDEERIDFFFKSQKWQGDIEIGEPDKCDKLEWINLDHLPENVVPYVRYAIEQYIKKQHLSFFGWGD